jgi:hypothetical protein
MPVAAPELSSSAEYSVFSWTCEELKSTAEKAVLCAELASSPKRCSCSWYWP